MTLDMQPAWDQESLKTWTPAKCTLGGVSFLQNKSQLGESVPLFNTQMIEITNSSDNHEELVDISISYAPVN
jgi:hypothetical protein